MYGYHPLDFSSLSVKENVDGPYKYLRVLASHKVNLLIVSLVDLLNILVKVKHDMRTNPRLELPDDPISNIWTYFSIMKVTPVVMDNFL